jgi:AcrR family transcriptional regulator
VLDAGTRLLEERGYEGFTLAEVSRRARVSIGSIYARAPSKDVLFRAIHERAMERVALEQREPWAGADLPTPALIVRAVGLVAAPMRAHGPLLRVFMHRGVVDGVIAARGAEISRQVGDRFKELVLTRRREFTQADPDLASDVAFRLVYCTLARQLMYGPAFESTTPIGWDALVAELGEVCVRYLTGR